MKLLHLQTGLKTKAENIQDFNFSYFEEEGGLGKRAPKDSQDVPETTQKVSQEPK